jgi:hypothetical protein
MLTDVNDTGTGGGGESQSTTVSTLLSTASATDDQNQKNDQDPNIQQNTDPNQNPDNAGTDQNAQKPDGNQDGDKDPNKPEGAPEQYQGFTLPEGVTIDGDVLTEATSLFKTLNIPQDQAQKLIDIATKNAQKQSEAFFNNFQKTVEDWGEQTKTELGADFEKKIGVAITGAKSLGGDEFLQLLEDTGLGSHPVMMKALIKAGQMTSEDGFVSGSHGKGAANPMETFFPNSKLNQ